MTVKSASNIIFFIAGLLVAVNEFRKLLTTSIFDFSLGDELIVHYLKCLFYFLALPIFLVCEALEFFGVIPEESVNHYHIHLFYYTVYIALVAYGAALFLSGFI